MSENAEQTVPVKVPARALPRTLTTFTHRCANCAVGYRCEYYDAEGTCMRLKMYLGHRRNEIVREDHIDRLRDGAEIERLLRLEAIEIMLMQQLAEQGITTADEPHPLLKVLLEVMKRRDALARELGLTPNARAQVEGRQQKLKKGRVEEIDAAAVAVLKDEAPETAWSEEAVSGEAEGEMFESPSEDDDGGREDHAE